MNTEASVVWQGKFGDADLKIEIPPNGRIHAEWTVDGNARNKVVDSIEQLERSVLFQLMVGKEIPEERRDEVVDAVAITLANRLPVPAQERPRQKRGGPAKKRGRGRPGGRPGGRRRGGRRRR